MRGGWGCHAVAVVTTDTTTVVAALQILQLHIAILLGACVVRFVPASSGGAVAAAAGQRRRCTGYRFRRDVHLKDVLLLVAKLLGGIRIGGSVVDGRSVDHNAVLAAAATAVHYCMTGPMMMELGR